VPTVIVEVYLTAFAALVAYNTFFLARRARRLAREVSRLRATLLRMHLGGEDGDDSGPAGASARMMASLVDATGPVADAANGARRQREEEGWSSTAAEQMAQMLYMMGMAKIAAAVTATFDDDDD